MKFSIRTQRRFYLACTIVLGLGVVWVTWSEVVALQAESSITTSITPLKVSTTLGSKSDDLRPTSPDLALETFRGRVLRGPLYDPPPPPPPPVVPPPPLRLKLLGTVIEPGDRSQAILMTGAGQVEMHRVGAVLEDAVIETIDPTSITVRYHGQSITLSPEP